MILLAKSNLSVFFFSDVKLATVDNYRRRYGGVPLSAAWGDVCPRTTCAFLRAVNSGRWIGKYTRWIPALDVRTAHATTHQKQFLNAVGEYFFAM